jgi:hypothetical protein
MLTTVTPQQRQAAKRELIKQIEQGASAREARASSVVPMHRTTIYRLLKRVQREREQAFIDGRQVIRSNCVGKSLPFWSSHAKAILLSPAL